MFIFILAFLGSNFTGNTDAVFANSYFWVYLASFIAYGYSNLLCIDVKIYIMLVCTVVTAVCYVIAEYIVKNRTYEDINIDNKVAKEEEEAGCHDSFIMHDGIKSS